LPLSIPYHGHPVRLLEEDLLRKDSYNGRGINSKKKMDFSDLCRIGSVREMAGSGAATVGNGRDRWLQMCSGGNRRTANRWFHAGYPPPS
jgi:hypothetical protein